MKPRPPAAGEDRTLPEEAERLLRRYLDALAAERNLSPYTLRNYGTDLRDFLRFVAAGPGRNPLAADRNVLRAYLAARKEEGMASASLTRKVSTVRGFYRWLAQEGHIPADPFAAVRGPKRERRLPRFLTPEQIQALIQAPRADSPQGLRDRAILELLYAAGIRVSELAGLRLVDVDPRERTVRVRGKGNKERVALMGVPAVRALARYLRHGRPALAGGRPADALFLNRWGGPLSVRAVQLLIRRYAAAAGIDERAYPHLLRHTFATHMLDGGADVRVVQALMGHASVGTTQIYTHVTDAQQRRVYDEAFYNAWQPPTRRRRRDGEAPEEG
ncbi:MAG TPA: site-specific tyrosine recombinase/integron integrase [Dehalococcoidia bacterium]